MQKNRLKHALFIFSVAFLIGFLLVVDVKACSLYGTNVKVNCTFSENISNNKDLPKPSGIQIHTDASEQNIQFFFEYFVGEYQQYGLTEEQLSIELENTLGRYCVEDTSELVSALMENLNAENRSSNPYTAYGTSIFNVSPNTSKNYNQLINRANTGDACYTYELQQYPNWLIEIPKANSNCHLTSDCRVVMDSEQAVDYIREYPTSLLKPLALLAVSFVLIALMIGWLLYLVKSQGLRKFLKVLVFSSPLWFILSILGFFFISTIYYRTPVFPSIGITFYDVLAFWDLSVGTISLLGLSLLLSMFLVSMVIMTLIKLIGYLKK